MNYGFVKSKIDGTEQQYQLENIKIPKKYSYKKYLPKVLNQGQRPICVPCSLSAFINWSINNESGNNKADNGVNFEEIFKNRSNDSNDGMSFKDAFYYLRHSGVKTDNGIFKIGRYAKIGSIIQLKQAIVINGPCVGGLPVYCSDIDEFWSQLRGTNLEGGHAVAITGYNEEGFIIRNSWGKNYGDEGYAILPYDDFNKFYEIWTIIEDV